MIFKCYRFEVLEQCLDKERHFTFIFTFILYKNEINIFSQISLNVEEINFNTQNTGKILIFLNI